VVDKGTKNSHFKTPQTIRLIGAFLASQQQSDAASVAPFTAKLLTTYTQAYLGATLDLSGRGSTLSHSFSEFVGACVTDADVKSVIAPEIERLLKRDPAKTVPGLAILCEGVAARTDLSAYVGVWKESLFKELVSNDASRSETAARALKALHRGVRGVDARIELIGQAQEYLGGRQRSLATKPADKVKVMTVIQDCMAAHTDEKTQTAGIDAMLAYVKSERIVGTRNAAMGVLAAVCEGLPAGPLLTQALAFCTDAASLRNVAGVDGYLGMLLHASALNRDAEFPDPDANTVSLLAAMVDSVKITKTAGRLTWTLAAGAWVTLNKVHVSERKSLPSTLLAVCGDAAAEINLPRGALLAPEAQALEEVSARFALIRVLCAHSEVPASDILPFMTSTLFFAVHPCASVRRSVVKCVQECMKHNNNLSLPLLHALQSVLDQEWDQIAASCGDKFVTPHRYANVCTRVYVCVRVCVYIWSLTLTPTHTHTVPL
jgi:hypothetical protein